MRSTMDFYDSQEQLTSEVTFRSDFRVIRPPEEVTFDSDARIRVRASWADVRGSVATGEISQGEPSSAL